MVGITRFAAYTNIQRVGYSGLEDVFGGGPSLFDHVVNRNTCPGISKTGAAYQYFEDFFEKPLPLSPLRRFPEGEKVFSAKPLLASLYYEHTLVGTRWPDAESALATDATCALKYAKTWGQPFPLGELVIFSNENTRAEYGDLLQTWAQSSDPLENQVSVLLFADEQAAPALFAQHGLDYHTYARTMECLGSDYDTCRAMLIAAFRHKHQQVLSIPEDSLDTPIF